MRDSVSTSPRIAILGAGPIGLEAGLAAADAGFDFCIYETAPHAAGNVRRWGHVRLFSPWDLNVSERMARHLEAAGHDVPTGKECPTGDELADQLLEPVASLSEITSNLATSTKVVAVGRKRLLKHEEVGTELRAQQPFRLVVRGPDGVERVEEANIILDCTGTYSKPNALGGDGIAAPGEAAADSHIVRHIPNPTEEPSVWAGKTLLLVGAGHSAQTAISDLADFAKEHPETRVIWAMRSTTPSWRIDPDDPLPERSELAARAADIASGASEHVEVMTGVVVDALHHRDTYVDVELAGRDGEHHVVKADLIVSLTGYIGDAELYRQLQVHECYATSGPMNLAAALQGGSDDCLDQKSHGADTLASPEPGFFILGIKSYGRTGGFLMRVGWDQVDEVFSILDHGV